MKPLLSVRLVGTTARDPAEIALRSRQAMLRRFQQSVTENFIPKLREYAPGSIGEQIRISTAKIVNGELVVEVTMPGKYRWVEEGVSESKLITPTPESREEYGARAVLILADGSVRMWSHITPREGKHFIERAFNEAVGQMCFDALDGVFYDIG